MKTQAPGKINVCLLLGPTRPHDGRHELVTVMQSVSLHDDVAIEPADADDVPGIAWPLHDDLAHRALQAFREHAGKAGAPARITITKRIPVAAGMAGGSADAGAVLRLLGDRHGVPDDDLRAIAATLGADVPAQVRPGRHLATGAGEIVAALPAVAPYGILVLPVDHELRTPDVYREADRLGLARSAAELAAGRERLQLALPDLPATHCVNELEPAARSLCPDIDEALDAARAAGADHVMVSGSGPTVLGFFATVAAAANAAATVGREAYAVTPVP